MSRDFVVEVTGHGLEVAEHARFSGGGVHARDKPFDRETRTKLARGRGADVHRRTAAVKRMNAAECRDFLAGLREQCRRSLSDD